VTRLARNLVYQRGIPLLANVSEALRIEGDADSIDDLAAETEALLVRASQEQLSRAFLVSRET
jgi:hypothetical protein